MPNTTVKFKSALVAAIIAGSVFQVLQWGYIHFQIGVSEYDAIYGSFAAFPLFLIFLQMAWLIVLFGAEISYSYQNVSIYEFEKDIKNLSNNDKRLVCLAVLHTIVKTFEKGEMAKSTNCIIKDFGAPVKLVENAIQMLLKSGLIAEAELDNVFIYLPSTDINKMDLSYVITRLGDAGSGNIPFDQKGVVLKFSKKLDSLRKEVKISDQNVLIKDI